MIPLHRGEGTLSPKHKPKLGLEVEDVVAGAVTYVFTPTAGLQGMTQGTSPLQFSLTRNACFVTMHAKGSFERAVIGESLLQPNLLFLLHPYKVLASVQDLEHAAGS